ncbi:MAG: hypothetical protein WCS94_05970 [Verrucomicrobiota bacterium]
MQHQDHQGARHSLAGGNSSIFTLLRRLAGAAALIAWLAAATGVTATEALQNGSFAAGTNYWQSSPELTAWGIIWLPSVPNYIPIGTNLLILHPVHGFLGPIVSQDLKVTNVAGAELIAKITLSKYGGPLGPTNSIAIYADYVDADGLTNRILLQNPADADLPYGKSTVTNQITLPSSARTLVRYAIARLESGSFESSGVSLDVQTGIVHNGGFETGDLTCWAAANIYATNSLEAIDGTNVVLLPFSGQPTYLSQDIAGRLTAGVAYKFSGWFYFSTLGGPPMQHYGPFLRISSSANMSTALSGGDAYLSNPDYGWNLLEFTRVFTAEELSSPVYFGVLRNLGMSQPMIDGLSAQAVTPSSPPELGLSIMVPSEGETNTVPFLLRAAVTNRTATVASLQFYANGAPVGEGRLDPHGEWLFADGSRLSVMGGGGYESADFSEPYPGDMFFMNGAFTSQTNFSGGFQYFPSGGGMGGGAVSVGYRLDAADRLTAVITGDAPMGIRTLSNGTNGGDTINYGFFWANAPGGNCVITARAVYNSGLMVTSPPVNITVIGSVPPVPPVLKLLPVASSSVGFQWETTLGQTCHVESTINLANPNWQPVGDSITATNTTTSISYPASGEIQRFYRVVTP